MRPIRILSLLAALTVTLCCLPAKAADGGRTAAVQPAVCPSPEDNSGWLLPRAREYHGQFTDVGGAWCEPYVKVAYEAGLMEGRTPQRFDPHGTLTEAQRLVIGARLHALLHGNTVEPPAPVQPWWLPAARYYLEVDGNTSDDPAAFSEVAAAPATRLSFALQMARSVPAEGLPPINAVTALPDFDDGVLQSMEGAGSFGETPILRLYQAGVLNGVDQWGKFDFQGTLTRGQAAAMLARAVDPGLRLRFQLPEFDLCRDVFGWTPDDVVLTVDGAPVSAEVFSLPLANSLLSGTESALPLAQRSVQRDLAAEKLVAEKTGVSLEQLVNWDEIPPAAAGPGVGDAAARWRGRHDALLSLLAYQYDPDAVLVPLFGYPEAMEQSLTEVMRCQTVTPSALLKEPDLSAARTRLLSSPYCYRTAAKPQSG